MKASVQRKIGKFKRLSDSGKFHVVPSSRTKTQDSLSKAIHSKKDADNFIAEVKSARKG